MNLVDLFCFMNPLTPHNSPADGSTLLRSAYKPHRLRAIDAHPWATVDHLPCRSESLKDEGSDTMERSETRRPEMMAG